MEKTKLYNVLLIGLVLICIAFRLYKLTAPLADWHSWRQADTAAVARNFQKTGIDLLHPRYDDLSNIQSGLNNPEGWRMVEFPLYQGAAVLLADGLGLGLEISLRLVTIFSAVVTLIFLVSIARIVTDKTVAIISGLAYACMPYSIFYGRAILPEVMATALATGSLYFFLLFLETKRLKTTNIAFLLSIVLGALALLVKPTSGFLLLPLGYFIIVNIGSKKRLIIYSLIYGIMCIFPFWWWRVWIKQYPEGIAAYSWLFNEGNIRLKGAWFYWLFAERIGNLILGYWGLIFFGLGIMIFNQRRKYAFFGKIWFLSMIVYFMIIARGNVQHDYYQAVIIPVLAFISAEGLTYIYRHLPSPLVWKIPALLTMMIFSIAFSWYTIRTYYWVNRADLLKAGQAADKILPTDAKVIAPNNGDTTFLYYINRRGWPLGFDIDTKIAQGATHYVTVSPTDNDAETKELASKYKVLIRNENYAIIDLTHKNGQ